MKPSVSIRIYWKDWNKIRKLFPPENKDESAGHYIERLTVVLQTHDWSELK